ncbi:aldehyde dehydrogenase family protein [Micromonospora aurantiaca (nom. illeg.)]|uniref:aldehyde dehydrogenase family protein n=1 Tax=Micromonospora aurantiaca (nom. illeg.) TaxID=47850 RepID=UPI003EBDDA21
MTATAEHAPAMTIGGVAEEAAAVLPVDNPATGAPLGAAPVCSGRQLDRAMDAALAAAGGWAADDEARRAALLAAAKEVSRAASRLGALVTAEQGKPAAMAIAEAYGAAGALRYHAGLDLGAELLRDDRRGHVELARRPLGVVAAITPWNFPVAIAAAKLAPALRAGNTVVLKPSPYAPLAVLELGRLLAPLFPPGVVNVVSGGDDLGAAMVAHPVPAHVSFTGSVAAGRRVAASAGAGLKRVTLELGGNDPAILLDDADPDAIAEKLFWEAFANSGQACMLVKRLYVPASRHGRVVDALADRARATRVGDGAVKGTELGPLTTGAQLRRVTALVEAATAGGARVAAGGAPLPGPGRFYAPTVLAGATDDLAVVTQEQFGPVLPVVPYTDLDDAVRAANAGPYGLGASVWSADPQRAWDVAARLDAGTVWVNSHAELTPDQPYGGLKCSGLGVEGGVAGLHGYTGAQVRHRPR